MVQWPLLSCSSQQFSPKKLMLMELKITGSLKSKGQKGKRDQFSLRYGIVQKKPGLQGPFYFLFLFVFFSPFTFLISLPINPKSHVILSICKEERAMTIPPDKLIICLRECFKFLDLLMILDSLGCFEAF